MGNDASEPLKGARKDAMARLTWPLTEDQRALAIEALKRLGKAVAGPDPRALINLIEEACVAFQVPVPATHHSLNDFVPAHLRVSFDAREEDCQRALHSLIKNARTTRALMETPPELTPCKVDPFGGVLTRYLRLAPEFDREINRVVAAIRLLADLQIKSGHAKRLGRKPINDLARIIVRATYYYRALHGLPLDVNFDYLRHPEGAKGTRSGPGELSPRTATSILACNAVQLFNGGTDVAGVKTHLDNYGGEICELNQKPSKADFLSDFSW